jgi:hypothetical protein
VRAVGFEACKDGRVYESLASVYEMESQELGYENEVFCNFRWAMRMRSSATSGCSLSFSSGESVRER